jgi:hypothetical protein
VSRALQCRAIEAFVRLAVALDDHGIERLVRALRGQETMNALDVLAVLVGIYLDVGAIAENHA